MFQRRLFLSPHVASWLLSKRGKLTQLVSVGVLLSICSGVYGTLSGPFFEATISPGASTDGVAYRALSVLSPSGVPNALLIPVLIVCTAICKAIGTYLFRVGRPKSPTARLCCVGRLPTGLSGSKRKISSVVVGRTSSIDF